MASSTSLWEISATSASSSSLLLFLLMHILICATPTSSAAVTAVATMTLKTLVSRRMDLGGSGSIRSVATTYSAAGNSATNNVFFAVLGAGNSSINAFTESTGVITPIVHNSTGNTCLDFNPAVTTFSATYPITPNAVCVSHDAHALYIADRTPSSHIYTVKNIEGSFSSNPVLNVYQRVVGIDICNGSTSPLVDGAIATSTPMMSAEYLALDNTDGTLYFTQSSSVFALTTDGRVHTYFGNEFVAGNRSTEPYTAVQRLSARTSEPGQISIDEIGRTMYVAESDMGTVRAIDMATGIAQVVLGYFESFVFPPADCSVVPINGTSYYNSNRSVNRPCTANNVTLILPMAVALYRAMATGERWLFVGDLTAAVIYRLNLDTNRVDVVAGRMLSSGAVDGTQANSQLFAIRSFALGYSALYIADGSALRKLDLNDHPTPPPAIIPPSVVTTTSTTVVIATLIVGFVNPTAVTQASRSNMVLNLARCERDFGGALPIFVHLLQFPVGDDNDFQYFSGAIIGNVSLCLGVLVLNFLVVIAHSRIAKRSIGESASILKFPSLVALPLLFVLEPTTSVSLSLVLYAASVAWEVALGAIGLFLCAVAFGVISAYFIFFFTGKDDFEMLERKYSGLIARMVNPVGEWLQTELTGQMGLLFEDYLPKCWWFVVIELCMCVVSGIIEGIRPDEQSHCLALIGVATVVFTAFFVSILYYQPYTVRFTFFIRLAIAGMQMVSTFLSLAYVKTEDPKWEAAAISLILAAMYTAGIDSVFSLLMTIRDVVKYLRFPTSNKHRHPRDRLNVNGRRFTSSSESGEDEELLLTAPLNSSITRYHSKNNGSIEDDDSVGLGKRQSSSEEEEQEMMFEEDERRLSKKSGKKGQHQQQDDDYSPPLAPPPKRNKHEQLRQDLESYFAVADTTVVVIPSVDRPAPRGVRSAASIHAPPPPPLSASSSSAASSPISLARHSDGGVDANLQQHLANGSISSSSGGVRGGGMSSPPAAPFKVKSISPLVHHHHRTTLDVNRSSDNDDDDDYEERSARGAAVPPPFHHHSGEINSENGSFVMGSSLSRQQQQHMVNQSFSRKLDML